MCGEQADDGCATIARQRVSQGFVGNWGPPPIGRRRALGCRKLAQSPKIRTMAGASYGVTFGFNESGAYPQLETARAALRELDWPQVEAFFDKLPDQNARSFVYQHLGTVESKGTDAFIAERARSERGSGIARTLYAHRLIHFGWNARGHLRAKSTSAAQFADFQRELASAEQILAHVVHDDDGNASAWAAGIATAYALQMSQAESLRRYQQAVKADPHHFRAQKHLIQKLAPKWGGSWEAMHDFARTCMLEAPKGKPNAVFVIDAHLEHWVGLGRGLKAQRYLRRAEVRDEIYQAAERSVQHPAFGKPYEWVLVRSTFAMVFSLLGDQQAAAQQFRALGRYASRHPWWYCNTPEESLQRRRAKALSAAG